MESARAAAQADASSALSHRIGKWTTAPQASRINGPVDQGEESSMSSVASHHRSRSAVT
ncbi:hypothetical protein [Streptomyces murinus]|uniref:hypothetical protein n=1 Tax=Streptomyces murinus TaxID=33900 RepID=UPI00372B69F1